MSDLILYSLYSALACMGLFAVRNNTLFGVWRCFAVALPGAVVNGYFCIFHDLTVVGAFLGIATINVIAMFAFAHKWQNELIMSSSFSIAPGGALFDLAYQLFLRNFDAAMQNIIVIAKVSLGCILAIVICRNLKLYLKRKARCPRTVASDA